eukprot:UN09786
MTQFPAACILFVLCMAPLDLMASPESPESQLPVGNIQISESSIHIVAWVVCILLSITLIVVIYINCCSSIKAKRKYSKVRIIASSDDDMQNLKEYQV